MYKLLVVTYYSELIMGAIACSVHSVVIEFDTREQADIAFDKLPKSSKGTKLY